MLNLHSERRALKSIHKILNVYFINFTCTTMHTNKRYDQNILSYYLFIIAAVVISKLISLDSVGDLLYLYII